MSIVQKFEWLMQKCKEGFGDAVKTVFKNIFTWLIFVTVSIFGFFLIFVRQYLDHTFNVSIMQILIILVVFFVIVGVVHWVIYRLRRRLTPSRYCRDVIYDVVWEWDSVIFENVGDIRDLTPICPLCAYEVSHTIHPKYFDHVMMTCHSCYWTEDLQGDWDSIKSDVIRVIKQRIRNNDFKIAKKRLKAKKG